MNSKLIPFFILTLISGCSGIKITNKAISAPTASEIVPNTQKLTIDEDSTYIPIIDTESENKDKQLLADNMEMLTPDLFIDGVAHPDNQVSSNKKIYFLEGAEELNLENNYFDIPVVYNKQVKKWITYFTTRGRKYFSSYVERAGRYAPMIGNLLEKNDLPRDLIFLAMAESGFNNQAKSIASAVGPWQFMPATGKSYSLNQNWYVDERKDPIKATIAAAQYLGKLYKDFGQWEVATAAYNAGEGKIGRAIKKYKTDDFWELSNGKYLKSETKNYVPKIMALAIIGKNLKRFGFTDLEFRAPLDYEEISVPAMTDLSKLADKLELDYAEVKKLNPEVLRWFTPPNVSEYKLRLPVASAYKYASCCLKEDFRATGFQQYKVKKNTTLPKLSKLLRFKNSYALAHLNSLSPKARLKKGTTLDLPFKKGDKLALRNIYSADQSAKNSNRKKVSYKLHRVKKGESLYSIAKKHKTSVRRIIAYNSSIPNSKKLFPGEKLIIR